MFVCFFALKLFSDRLSPRNVTNGISDELTPSYSGYLERKRPFNTWTRFWFELVGDSVKIYADQSKSVCKWTFSIDHSSVVLPLNAYEGRQHAFSLKVRLGLRKKNIILNAPDTSSQLQWIRELDHIILEKVAIRKGLVSTASRDDQEDKSEESDADTLNISTTGESVHPNTPKFYENHKSLMSRVLSADNYLYTNMAMTTPSTTWSFDHIIQPGLDQPDLEIGCVAGDEECYVSYRVFFDLLLKACSCGDSIGPPKTDLDASQLVGDIVVDSVLVTSLQLSVRRNIRGLRLPPACSRAERRRVDDLISTSCLRSSDDIVGTYVSLDSSDVAVLPADISPKLILQKPIEGSLMHVSGCARDWPDARGVFFEDRGKLAVWVNELDHMRIVTSDTENAVLMFSRLCKVLKAIEAGLNQQGAEYMFDEHYGYLTTCPSMLGSGMEASATMRLPSLTRDVEALTTACGRLGVTYSRAMEVVEISVSPSVSYSEAETVQILIDAVNKLVELEKWSESESSISERVFSLPAFSAPRIQSYDLDRGAPIHSSLDISEVDDYPRLTPKHTSLMAQHLTADIYHSLSGQKTQFGFTLSDSIRCGIDCPSLPVGIVAGDEESWHLFSRILEPVVRQWHGCVAEHMLNVDLEFRTLENVNQLTRTYVKSCSLSVVRNIQGYAYAPCITRGERRAVEQVIVQALGTLALGDFAGKYDPLAEVLDAGKGWSAFISGMECASRPPYDSLLSACGAARDWPDGRGVFHIGDGNLLVTVNVEDHLKIEVCSEEEDLSLAFSKLKDLVAAVEQALESKGYGFQHSPRLGFLTTCPSNLGTGLRVSFTISLPQIGYDEEQFKCIVEPFGLLCKLVSADNFLWTIMNKGTVGVSELEIAQSMINAAAELILLERKMEAGSNIAEFLPEEWVHSSFPHLLECHSSCMAATLRRSPELYTKLRGLFSDSGFSFDNVIQPGLDQPALEMGCVAGDEACYALFREFFDSLLKIHHKRRHLAFALNTPRTYLDSSQLTGDVVVDGAVILSLQLSVRRNIRGLSLPPACSRAERRRVEDMLAAVFVNLSGELRGRYTRKESTLDSKCADVLAYPNPIEGSLMHVSGCARDWPDARGVFFEDRGKLAVWVNELDHMRIVTSDTENAVLMFSRLCKVLKAIEAGLNQQGAEYMFDEHYGYLTTCPSMLGSGMEASATMRLPSLTRDVEALTTACGRLGVTYSRAMEVVEISVSPSVSYSEAETVQILIDAVNKLATLERALQCGDNLRFQVFFQEEISTKFTPPSLPKSQIGTDKNLRSTVIARMPPANDYPRFTSQHVSVMASCLSPDIYAKLYALKTSSGFTLSKAIQCGIDVPSLPIGVVAGDEESWDLFRELLEAVVKKWHNCVTFEHQLRSDFDPSNASHLNQIEMMLDLNRLEGSYVQSCSVSVVRNIAGYAYSPCITRGDRRALERYVVAATSAFKGDLTGEYFSINDEVDEDEDHVMINMMTCPPSDSLLGSSGGARDWPDGRGIFHNRGNTLFLAVNKEEHIKIASGEDSSNIVKVMERLHEATSALESELSKNNVYFQHSPNLGYLTCCPSLLGTGFRAKMDLKLRNVGRYDKHFETICEQLGVNCRRMSGSPGDGGIWEVISRASFGVTEHRILQVVVDAVAEIISIEKKLAAGASIVEFLPAAEVCHRYHYTIANPPGLIMSL